MRAHEFIHAESKFGNFKGGRYRYTPTGKAFNPFDSKNYKIIAQDSGGILSPADVEELIPWYAEAMGDGLTPEEIAQHADPTDPKFQSLAQVMLLKLSPMREKTTIQKKLDEDLRKWFKEKWVRFGPDGKIRGACARGSKKEGKPKCLPQRKAHALGQKGRASAAARKRRQDPNANRKGSAKNVSTKSKRVKESYGAPTTENFADGRGPGRPGDSARLGIPKSATIAQLEKIRSDPNSSKRKKQLAHWQINMRRGKKKS